MSEGIAETLRQYFAAHGDELAAVYLFGSVARGTAGPASDVDIAVLPRKQAGGRRGLDAWHLDLEGELERLLGREVQVVALDSAPPDLVHRVLADGTLVHEGDRSARIAFEVRLRNEYFDLLPYLREYRKQRVS